MSTHIAATVGLDVPTPRPAAGRGRSRTIVLATVLSWNALALAALVAWAAITVHNHSLDEGEGWTGVLVLIVVAVLGAAILASTIIGVTVAAVRTGKPGWPARPLSTGRAVAVGCGDAAWGLCAFLAIPLLLVAASAIGALG